MRCCLWGAGRLLEKGVWVGGMSHGFLLPLDGASCTSVPGTVIDVLVLVRQVLTRGGWFDKLESEGGKCEIGMQHCLLCSL